MKYILIALIAVCITAGTAFPATTQVMFNNLSTTGNSSAFRVPVGLKSVIAKGYTNARAEQALGGTFALSCAPGADGPWVACKDQAGNAVSVAADGTFNLNNSFTWVRGTWTRTTGNIKAWLIAQ